MREAFRWDFIWSDVRALSFCTMGSKSFWGRIWILGSLSFHKMLSTILFDTWNRLKALKIFFQFSSVCKNSNAISKRYMYIWKGKLNKTKKGKKKFRKDFALLCITANSRSLRMTNANTLTTKSTSLSFKRNLKSRRVYFQMSNPLILYAKKSLALVE